MFWAWKQKQQFSIELGSKTESQMNKVEIVY